MLWTTPLERLSFSPPAVANGKVYLASLDLNGSGSNLWIFDATDGTQLSRTPLTAINLQ